MTPWILAYTLLGAANAGTDKLATWHVELDGTTVGAFKAVDGLDAETELVLIEGFDLSATFLDWADGSVNGKERSLSFDLVHTTTDGTETVYTLVNAEVDALSGKGTATTQEEIEMVVERIEKG